eukprot:scaffold21178_cov98-Skeletonema_dohrnii-CCMP3373.AAC.3
MSESDGNDNSQQSAESFLSKKLYEICNSESLSKEGLHEIIDQHDLTHNNHHVSDYKFFFQACINNRVNEGIIQCLLEYFPAAASATDQDGSSPLHVALQNPVDIIQLLIDAAPASVRSVTNEGRMPLHHLCTNNKVDDVAALEILELLIMKQPEAAQHADNYGQLPIHFAAGWGRRSTEFCRLLIESYPGSERITDVHGNLPIHLACTMNTVATVEYFYKLYPEVIHHKSTRGFYPIHFTILSVKQILNPIAAVDIVKFLLECDPKVKLQKGGRKSLLQCACCLDYNDSNIEVALEVIQAIYDAHPEAIEEYLNASNIQRYHQQVQAFINNELVYARQAKDHPLMTTPDGNGLLPLHTALQNNATLGSIKLLVKGNPTALRFPDNSGKIPLHVACQHHDSAEVIQYLIELDALNLDAVDRRGDSALHYACRGAKYDTIAMLLEKYNAVSVSKRNAQKKLPIDILWESNDVLDRESVEYTGSVFRLLKAYPEAVMNIDMQQQQSAAASCPSQNGKKRKFGEE